MRFDALLTVRCDVLEVSSLLLSLVRSYSAFLDRCWLAARPPTWSVGAIVLMTRHDAPVTRRNTGDAKSNGDAQLVSWCGDERFVENPSSAACRRRGWRGTGCESRRLRPVP